ncbi:MAG TPA: hypothetical protein VHJ34_06925 [Actinomycetota bacterium]|nr:hypothetical protein [Actinomycetota bacterium]
MASLNGHEAFGYDTDPLAVLIARVWGRPLPSKTFLREARAVVERAKDMRKVLRKPYALDDETQTFIDFWFDQTAQVRLAALAAAIVEDEWRTKGALWCAFSRLIITKDTGASRARDVSHSRPHRVRDRTTFNPIDEFEKSANVVLRRHQATSKVRPTNSLFLGRHDARRVPLEANSIDFVMTSPPYLNAAIDYMRGHRLSLVWMGYSLADLRALRTGSVGSATGMEPSDGHIELIDEVVGKGNLPLKGRRIVAKYLHDLEEIVRETGRVLVKGGRAVFVVADSVLLGVKVRVGDLLTGIAEAIGLELEGRETRAIAADRRYLPPPSRQDGSLDKRMREEICLSFSAAG